jgi:sulfate transport system ATP-binding protein
MNAGRIEQYAPPQEVYEKPASAFVFKFLGNYNLFHARAASDETFGEALVRPHDIVIHRDPAAAGPDARPGRVSHIGFGGPIVKVELETAEKTHVDVEMAAPAFRDLDLKRGENVWFALRAQPEVAIDYAI